MEIEHERAVIIFARSPKLGQVKTRLAESLGNEFALKFYTLCAKHVFDECRKLSSYNTRLYIFFAGDNAGGIKKLTGNSFSYFLQSGNDLGQRMENAFNLVFKTGAKKVLIIGTDVPDIDSSLIENSFELLNINDLVIGPSLDGGYYLLGLKKPYNDLFYNISWSTKSVFEETLKKIKSKKIKFKVTARLYDIDTEDDLRKWLSALNTNKNNSFKNKILKDLPR